MLPPRLFRERRRVLGERLGEPVLLVGNRPPPRNLLLTAYRFRQDSSFLYYTGCTEPGAAALLEGERLTLFLEPPGPDDALWEGEARPIEERAASLEPDRVLPRGALADEARRLGVRLALAVPDPAATAEAARLTGLELAWRSAPGPERLLDAVIAQRRVKSPEELEELERAAEHTAAALRAVQAATRPGENEAGLAALFEAVLAARGCETSFPTIATVRGEVLHNPHHREELRPGQLFLLDGGAEVPSGYAADVTRCWPVGGRFDERQRAAYLAVLAAHDRALELCRPGVRYRDVHLAAAREIARFLRDEGVLRVGVDEAVERGVHAVFFPHGVGHLLGLDVHDLEDYGDRAAYAPGRRRSSQFGLSYLRMDLDLEPGMVLTVEPGFYAVPAILERFREPFRDALDWDRALSWLGFGGIRIEDDVAVTPAEPRVLTASIPREPDELEALVGTGAPASERLS